MKKPSLRKNALRPLTAFSLDIQFSEQEFLSRELGLLIRSVSSRDLISIAHQNMSVGVKTVVVGEGSNLSPVLTQVPNGSLILIQISDENFSSNRLFLAGHATLEKVFRNYSPYPATAGDIFRSLVGFSGDTRWKPRFLRQAGGALRELMEHRNRATEISSKHNSSLALLPLGYTNKFAMEFANRFGLPESASLIDAGLELTSTHRQREYLVGFVGAPGRLQRQALFRVLERCGGPYLVDIIDNGRWLGHTDAAPSAQDYVTTLLDTEFSACPPGTIANESFRVMESAICGAFPLRLHLSITQGTRDAFPWFGKSFWSWREALTFVETGSFSPNGTRGILQKMRSYLELIRADLVREATNGAGDG